MMKHHNQAVDFSNLNFETINSEILANEAKEQEENVVAATATVVVGGDNATDVGRAE